MTAPAISTTGSAPNALASSQTLISRCIDALGGAVFLADGLSREFRKASIDPAAAGEELGWHVIDDVLACSTLEPNMIRLVGPAGRIEPATYTDVRMGGGQIVQRTLAAAPFRRELNRGATLVVNKADQLHRTVRANRERLEY
jgi:hypothetical protein